LTLTARDILSIAIYISAMIGGLAALHWRGMLKISEIRREVDGRLVALEEAVNALKEEVRMLRTGQ